MHKNSARRTSESSNRQPAERPTHWGEVAEWYDTLVGDEGSEYHREVILPGVMRMMGGGNAKAETRNAKRAEGNRRVLDLACGQGVLCRQLAAAHCEVV